MAGRSLGLARFKTVEFSQKLLGRGQRTLLHLVRGILDEVSEIGGLHVGLAKIWVTLPGFSPQALEKRKRFSARRVGRRRTRRGMGFDNGKELFFIESLLFEELVGNGSKESVLFFQ